MKFTIFAAALALFNGLVASAPVADAEADVQLEARQQAVYYPNNPMTVIWSPSYGYVSDSWVSIGRYTYQGVQYDTNTLLSYSLPDGLKGKTCQFILGNGFYAGGTRKVQLFSVGGPISTTDTFTSRPYRNIHYGIFTIAPDGASATWDAIPPPKFPCPEKATTLGYEVVPQGDEDWAGWYSNSGLAIQVV
ncbi:uncharacterized protein LAJ45_09372 [Morchella importuna]|uniref:Ubiquitin 3 binding protein But2 C-terminal domain-containing protein n=1 Tax=Morchella conica CCBAS932 TaxID=1392247 RepID=A0A3N4KES8_9PEZI|nr:uncharacterized protein LAJ45_09372 [Morchella importuna]KAH8146689.1 hypothetical protein LAJ45_09372 [Morchella importuna]RPB08997.1 hypothetical protein P167DRAFT_527763 [Morchella conica CCBAS932]